ncbi:hypothetical protein THAOC_37522 [Thalassiosira oceanica]|uniref:Uncharacterized protein n=1 Tax=Thalassiosira oceanica TaxID=159749 RepID=K0RBR2_THAOC|nr:hypothetical protein THAOC_37522 [Thalassiosira oceanica]|eukprot:EJK43982.1 hypothetical protein THAOC_37522 [Thalassiosira oceanica]
MRLRSGSGGGIGRGHGSRAVYRDGGRRGGESPSRVAEGRVAESCRGGLDGGQENGHHLSTATRPSSLFESALKWRGSPSQSPATLLLESNFLCQPRSTRTSPGRRGDGAACVVVLLDQVSQTISDDGGAKRTGNSRSPSPIVSSQGQTTDSRLLKLLHRRRPPHSLAEGRSLSDARVSNQLVSAGWPPTPCPRLPRLGACVHEAGGSSEAGGPSLHPRGDGDMLRADFPASEGLRRAHRSLPVWLGFRDPGSSRNATFEVKIDVSIDLGPERAVTAPKWVVVDGSTASSGPHRTLPAILEAFTPSGGSNSHTPWT